MRKLLFVTVLSMVLILTQLAFGQEQFALNGNGARAAGMGYAFTGVADDATAISWNAAGLTQLYSMEASIVGKLGFGSLTPNYDMFDVEVDKASSFQLNFASFVIPFNVGDLNVVGGVAYRTVYDFTSEEKWTVDGEDLFEDNQTGGVTSISPAIGVQVNEMISVGAAVNILMGSWESKEYDSNGDLLSEANSDFSGTAIDIGVLVKPSSQVQIGANLNLPYTLTETIKNGEDIETQLDVPLFFALGLLFRATDNFALAFDYRSRPWSSSEFSVEDQKIEGWELEDGNSIHVGLEYLAESGDTIIPLRLGFYTLPTPAVDDNDDQVAYNAATAGIGLVMGSIILDGSFEYIFGSYVGDEQNGQDVDYDYSDFRITVGATLHLGN